MGLFKKKKISKKEKRNEQNVPIFEGEQKEIEILENDLRQVEKTQRANQKVLIGSLFALPALLAAYAFLNPLSLTPALLICTSVFVFHHGAVSFNTEKLTMNQKKLLDYSNYNSLKREIEKRKSKTMENLKVEKMQEENNYQTQEASRSMRQLEDAVCNKMRTVLQAVNSLPLEEEKERLLKELFAVVKNYKDGYQILSANPTKEARETYFILAKNTMYYLKNIKLRVEKIKASIERRNLEQKKDVQKDYDIILFPDVEQPKVLAKAL